MVISSCLFLPNKETVCCPVPCCVCLDTSESVWMVLGSGHSLQLGCISCCSAFSQPIFLGWSVVSVTGILEPRFSAPFIQNVLFLFRPLNHCKRLWIVEWLKYTQLPVNYVHIPKTIWKNLSMLLSSVDWTTVMVSLQVSLKNLLESCS